MGKPHDGVEGECKVFCHAGSTFHSQIYAKGVSCGGSYFDAILSVEMGLCNS